MDTTLAIVAQKLMGVLKRREAIGETYGEKIV